MFLTILVFILILGLLIFVHEFGHFVMAKRAGVRVEEFGFGFPPRLFGIKKGDTIYSLNLLPLGGFVKIYGEDGAIKNQKEDVDNENVFYKKPIKTRVGILVAGVTMNLILAAVLLSVGYWIGLPTIIKEGQISDFKDAKVQILQVDFNSPAEQAGIKMGDTIASFKLQITNYKLQITEVSQVQEFINQHKGEEIIVVIQRGDEILEKTVVPRIDAPKGEGPLGISLAETAIVSYPWYRALVMGVTSVINLTWAITVALAGLLWQIIRTGQLAVDVAGPVGIFTFTGQAAQLGFIYVLQLTALLSINLAIINVLPFPALDGGRLLFLGIEKIKGSPISQKVERFANTTGFVILIMLMVAITWRDVARLF